MTTQDSQKVHDIVSENDEPNSSHDSNNRFSVGPRDGVDGRCILPVISAFHG